MVLGRDPPTDRDTQSWPRDIRDAFDSQTEIGWIQVFYGRLSIHWERLAMRSGAQSNHGSPFIWTRKVIRWCWAFSIDLWHARNEILHGPVGSVSHVERELISAKVRVMYQELRPHVGHRFMDSFSKTESEMLQQLIQTQVAWLEILRYLFPDKYGDLIKDTVGKIRSDQETELNRLQSMGMFLD